MNTSRGMLSVALVLAVGCEQSPEDTQGVLAEPEVEEAPKGPDLEIVPGVGIGPVVLGMPFSEVEAAYGEPDVLVEYKRVYFATWLELGVEVVVGSQSDDGPDETSMVVSVGTRLPDGFTGPVAPGMTRAEADAAVGSCIDVIDDIHCYHPVGVYMAYDPSGMIKTVAIHPAFTPREHPPEMLPALNLGGAR